MNCEDVNGSLVEYFGNDMGRQERHELEGHAGECRDCRTSIKTYRLTIFLAGQVLPKQPPADLYQQIRQKLVGRLPVTAGVSQERIYR